MEKIIMFKKIGIMVIATLLFASASLMAQSIDVKVHNVNQDGESVNLSIEYNNNGWTTTYTKPANGPTVNFYNIPCSQNYPITRLKAEQDSRSKIKGGNFSPFETYHIYLPSGIVPQPD